MNDQWQIALMSLFYTALIGVLGWIGSQLLGIRKELGAVVLKKDCVHDMENHCGLINKLQERVEANEKDLAVLLAVYGTKGGRE